MNFLPSSEASLKWEPDDIAVQRRISLASHHQLAGTGRAQHDPEKVTTTARVRACVQWVGGSGAVGKPGTSIPQERSAGRCLCTPVCVCVWLICFAHCIGNPLAPAVLLSVAFSMVCFCIAFVCVCVLVWQLEFHSAGLSLCSPASNNELCLCTVGAIFTQEHTTHRS